MEKRCQFGFKVLVQHLYPGGSRNRNEKPLNSQRSLNYPHPEGYLAGSLNRVNLTEYTRFGPLSLIEIPPKLKIHPESR